MSNLLARFAENAFWVARYMERAENLARTIDVNETFARDSHGTNDWLAIIYLNADEKRFFAKHSKVTAEAVVHFYLIDDENPSAIRSAVRSARENARVLRHLISTEMWRQLNVFYDKLLELGPNDISLSNLANLCTMIKEACQTHVGIVDGTLLHDESWLFYNIGKYIERADQTTRLLDIKFHIPEAPAGIVERYLDTSQWNTLLRSVAGYHAFIRIHPHGIHAQDVAAFLLTNLDFPRSVALCVATVNSFLHDLHNDHNLKLSRRINRTLTGLATAIDGRNIETIMRIGIHDFIDTVQRHLGTLTRELHRNFFVSGADTAR